MIKKPEIPWTTRLGGIGEAEVKARLTYFSIPTKYDIDPGLDFYCELLENNSPSLPFYVQAKATEYFDSKWGRSIPKTTLMYWLYQPSPVFLIVFAESEAVCYWKSIEELRYQLIEQIFNTDSETVYVKVDRSNVLEKRKEANQQFIDRIKEDYALLRLFHGQAIFRGDGYVKEAPHLPRSPLELQRVKENVRAGLYSLVQHCFAENDFANAKTYCEFLSYIDKNHYNHFAWLAQCEGYFGNFSQARKNLMKALQICEADKVWPRESLQEIKNFISAELDRLPEDAN